MGNKHTADGRWIVGNGNSGDDYKGFLHWRECYICLTESGATEESVDYLNALKDYALAHYAIGEPIMPPSMTVWVVANGKATAVQADDVKVEDGDYTICGITYSDGAWDYSNAGQGGGGGSSLPAVTEDDNGDVLTVVDGEWGKGDPPYTVEESSIERTVIFAEDSITLKNGGQANFDGFASAPTEGDTIEVVWDGNSYECVAEAFQEGAVKCGAVGILEGNPDWSVYPFCLILPLVTSGGGVAIAENNGTVTLAINRITGGTKTVIPSDDFKAAVAAVSSILVVNVELNDGTNAYVADKTLVEVCAAMNDKKPVAIGLGTYDGYSFALAYNEDGNGIINEIQWLETYINGGVPTIVNYVWTIADGIYEDGTYPLSTSS